MEPLIRSIDTLTKSEYERCLSLMEPGRRATVEALTNETARQRTVLGEWMAKTALSEQIGCPIEQIRLLRDEKGKPFAPDLPLHFSISHSGPWVVCAVSSNPVGVDIEILRPIDPKIAHRICHPEDLPFLEGKTEAEVIRKFFLLWTAKEARGKRDGTGLQNIREIPLSRILPRCHRITTEEYVVSVVE
ncbi:MAG: 4'-phosphopantetheinyl transferase superfamily protein [Clostridia bacterium]|nr:4'-phosphopantetheinyl transferase superfamily protein [Clostridia bacterium]